MGLRQPGRFRLRGSAALVLLALVWTGPAGSAADAGPDASASAGEADDPEAYERQRREAHARLAASGEDTMYASTPSPPEAFPLHLPAPHRWIRDRRSGRPAQAAVDAAAPSAADGEAAVHAVAFLPAAADSLREGFVRVINHGSRAGTVGARRAREQQLEDVRLRVREAERSQGRAAAAWAGCRRGTDKMKPDVAALDDGRRAAETFRQKVEEYRRQLEKDHTSTRSTRLDAEALRVKAEQEGEPLVGYYRHLSDHYIEPMKEYVDGVHDLLTMYDDQLSVIGVYQESFIGGVGREMLRPT